MTQIRSFRALAIIGAVALAFALLFLTGCKSEEEAPKTPEAGETAIGGLELARSALSTMAPDAKLLVVQTGEAVTPTSTPVWAYLFGSPETGSTYAVYVSEGAVLGASEYGDAGLTEEEWSAVPEVESWEIDSDAAYESALDVSGATGVPAAYFMGFQTYVPESMASTPTISAFTWYVSFDPGESGATTGTIAVDGESGEAAIVEE